MLKEISRRTHDLNCYSFADCETRLAGHILCLLGNTYCNDGPNNAAISAAGPALGVTTSNDRDAQFDYERTHRWRMTSTVITSMWSLYQEGGYELCEALFLHAEQMLMFFRDLYRLEDTIGVAPSTQRWRTINQWQIQANELPLR